MNGPNEMGIGKTDVESASASSDKRVVSRRDLLKGVAGGSALVAAARPIETLGQTTVTVIADTPYSRAAGIVGRRCSISGMQSVGASIKPSTVTCNGLSPGYFNVNQQFARWPGYTAIPPPANANFSIPNFGAFTIGGGFSARAGGTYPRYKAKDLFTAYGNADHELYDLMPGGAADGAPDEAFWLAAVLTALTGAGSAYPYSAQQIMDFYYTPSIKAQALAFLKGIML